MKNKKQKPWLTSTEVEIPTSQLKVICKSWSRSTWDAYLDWFEGSRREALVAPGVYIKKGEEQTEPIFEMFDQDNSFGKQLVAEGLLSTLPSDEARILRLKFFEGRTEREIAALTKTPKSSVHRIKNKAVLRLQRGHHGNGWGTRRYMRDANSEAVELTASPWMQPSSFKLREAKVYDLKNHKSEFEKLMPSSRRDAFAELSELQRQIIYLRFWCDLSTRDVARELKMGGNVVEQICDATVFKLKSRITELETISTTEGGPSCA